MQTPETLGRQWQVPREPDFQQFIPNSPIGYERWGKVPWQEEALNTYPDIMRTSLAPTYRESYGTIRGAGGQLGEWASPAVSGPAMMAGNIAKTLGPFLDYVGGGKFTPAFNRMERQSLAKQQFALRAQREYFEMERERMLDAADMAVRRWRADVEPARDIIEAYKDNMYSKNPGENERIATERLDEWAAHHPKLQAVLRNGGLQAAENWLNYEAAKVNDLAAGAGALRAGDRRRKEAAGPSELDREWSPEGESGGPQRDASGRLVLPQRPLPAPGETEPPAGPTRQDTEELSETDQKLAKDHSLSASAVGAAHDIFRDGSVRGMTPSQIRLAAPRKFGNVVSAAGDLDRQVRGVAGGQGTPEEKTEAIRNIDPAYAANLDSLRRYEKDPVSLRGNYNRDTSIAAMVDPNYKPGFYKQAQKYKDPNSKEGSVMTRTATLPAAGLAILDQLKDISENDINFKRNIDALMAEYYNGDPKYAALHQAIRTFLTDAIGIQSGTGTPRVTLVNDAAKTLLNTRSPGQIRRQMQVDLYSAFGMIQQMNRSWQRETGTTGNAPLYDQRNADMMDAMLRMNGFTGQVSEDAPDMLKAVGKPKPTGKDRPSWLKKGQDFAPLDRTTVNQARAWLEANPNDPDAQKIREQLRIIPDTRPPSPNAR